MSEEQLDDVADVVGEGVAGVEEYAAADGSDTGEGDAVAATNVPMDDLQPEATNQAIGSVDLDGVLDIPVTLSVEIGNTSLSIRNLLQLNQGSVVELDRLAGEALDVLVNGTLVAHGEVVVVNEKFGIRLTDVVSAQERVKKLA